MELCKWTGSAIGKCNCGDCVSHVAIALEWIQPVRKGYRMECCDCGLVHTMDFRVRNGRAQFRADRDNRRTAARRRARNIAVRSK